LPGYSVSRRKVKFHLLVDRDVPRALVDAVSQEFDVSIKTLAEYNIDPGSDERICDEALKLNRTVLTRNYTDFFHGPRIQIRRCPGIFAVPAHNESAIYKAVPIMGAFLREIGPFVASAWWKCTKLKIGSDGCSLHRFEGNRIVKRRFEIDQRTGRAWFKLVK
jgi:predicted nuclease of predicted toxin-antitoxin system